MFSTPQLNIFHMNFKNGYTISVSWVPSVSMSSNRQRPVSDYTKVFDAQYAEVIVFNAEGNHVDPKNLVDDFNESFILPSNER